jgi:hypothetical protein
MPRQALWSYWATVDWSNRFTLGGFTVTNYFMYQGRPLGGMGGNGSKLTLLMLYQSWSML